MEASARVNKLDTNKTHHSVCVDIQYVCFYLLDVLPYDCVFLDVLRIALDCVFVHVDVLRIAL